MKNLIRATAPTSETVRKIVLGSLALGTVSFTASIQDAQAAPIKIPSKVSAKTTSSQRPAHWPTTRTRRPITALPGYGKIELPAFTTGDATSGGIGNNSLGKLGDPNHMDSATTVDQWFQKMPEWGLVNKLKPSKNTETDKNLPNQTENGREYRTTETKHSITETPEKIVTYAPVDAFWLGGLVQQNGLSKGLGSLQEIPIPADKRAAFTITTDLPSGNNFRNIASPSSSAVNAAIGDLMVKHNKSNWGGAATFKLSDNYSSVQTGHDIGIDVRYMASEVSASLQSSTNRSDHTVTAAFIQRAFTASVDFKGNSRRQAFFSPKFTIADAKNLKTLKKVSTTNLPTYVKSITYGRVVLFNLTSTVSESDISAALKANINGATWGVDGKYTYNEALKNKSFLVQITALGGPNDGFSELVPAEGIENAFNVMNAYLKTPAPLTSMKPISYTVNTLRDDQLAEMSVTTSYTVTKYSALPIGERYYLKMWLEVTSAKDGETNGDDHEAYGDLVVNGDTKWVLRNLGKNSRTVDTGGIIKITEDAIKMDGATEETFTFDYNYKNKPLHNFRMTLLDWDKHSSNDTWFSWNVNLDLKKEFDKAQKTASKEYVYNSPINGHGGGKLHIRIERVGYL